jgi:uncharacterized cupredoxin-like copper-binding protein
MRQGSSAGARGALMLLCVLVCSAAAPVDWSHARRVEDVASDYKFTPNHLVFQSGVGYRLHLVNRGKEMHEFHSKGFFAAIDMRNPQILNADRDEIDLQPGDQKDLYFVARRAGRFKLYCPDHDWAGMTGEIEIR